MRHRTRAHLFAGWRQLHRGAAADRPAFHDAGTKPGVKQPSKDDRSLDELDKILARLTSLLTLALDLANSEATSDEVGQVDPANKHLASGLTWLQVDSVIRPQSLECLGFDQRDVAGAGVVVVPVTFEAPARMCDGGRHLVRHRTARGGQKYRFNPAFIAHGAGYCRTSNGDGAF